MKTITLILTIVSIAASASATDQAQLDDRIRLMTTKFEAMQQQPDKRVPAEVLKNAQGIILLDRTKAGFIFAYQGGNGLAMVKDASGNWSPAAFLSATEASLGFQIGGEQNFYVILLMTTNATQALSEPTIDLGGEARGTAGDQSSGVEGKVTTPEQSVLVYDDRNGLYGGVAIKGGAISPDEDADITYYGKSVSTSDILFDKKVQPTQAETDLIEKISDYSKH
jgi:lipid-binding SYLF domain-containing protein